MPERTSSNTTFSLFPGFIGFLTLSLSIPYSLQDSELTERFRQTVVNPEIPWNDRL